MNLNMYNIFDRFSSFEFNIVKEPVTIDTIKTDINVTKGNITGWHVIGCLPEIRSRLFFFNYQGKYLLTFQYNQALHILVWRTHVAHSLSLTKSIHKTARNTKKKTQI